MTSIHISRWALVTGLLASLAGAAPGGESVRRPNPSEDPADKEACEGNLNQIFEAIQQYRQQHENSLPDKLSDLTPEFLQDPKTLLCPVVQKQGGFRSWRMRLRELTPDPHTSYGYEFPPVLIGHDLWRGVPRKTIREWKERSVEKLGLVVPVVRCHDHRPVLNLAYDGQIYESGLDWESNFTKDDHLMMPSKLFAASPSSRSLVAADFPSRSFNADSRLIDLTPHYNARLTDSWQGFPGNNDLAGLSVGIREFDGVRFDVRGLIQLHGGDLPFGFPERVEDIKVGQKCGRLHFLHATGFFHRPGTAIACYNIHYLDGRVQEFSLVYGKQIADWWFDPAAPANPTDAKVVWTGENEAARAYGKSLRLIRASWDNPWPGTTIASISLVSKVPFSSLFLVAITLE